MYRQLKTRRLLLIVGLLLIAVAALTLKDYFKGDRSFRKNVLELDSAKIVSIKINTSQPSAKSIKLFKEKDQWKVSDDAHSYSADPGIVANILNELCSMKIESLAGSSSANWSEFEVSDSAGIKLSVEELGNKQIYTVFLGKFSYQKPTNPYDRQGKLSSYVRVAGEDETYSVRGFLRMNFAPEINNYRNKFLTKSSASAFSKISFTYPADSSFVLLKENNKWLINGMTTDSTKLDNYLSEIEHLSSYDFADTVKHGVMPAYSIKIEGSALPVAIELKAYKKDFTEGYVINSSFNAEAFFNGSAQSLFSKIFKGKKEFIM
jgi:hypothetical protein